MFGKFTKERLKRNLKKKSFFPDTGGDGSQLRPLKMRTQVDWRLRKDRRVGSRWDAALFLLNPRFETVKDRFYRHEIKTGLREKP